MQLAPAEEKMWEESHIKNRVNKMTDEQINAKYESGEQRILNEINREKLPNFVQALKKPGYMNVLPYSQRRRRWDEAKQSGLIESFLINVPVPPIILYKKDYSSYEVIDGQQRITTIQDFYENRLVLTGLELCSKLNGRTYDTLPTKIKAVLDRRSISMIVLITELISDPEETSFLKRLVFERLNMSGEPLSSQEVRNYLYSGKFNPLLFELASHSIFAEAWQIPTGNREELMQNNLYKKMEDVELVLRFFALRHIEDLRGGIKEFLDLYMIKSLQFSDEDINILREIFLKTINLAHKIYEDNLFKPFNSENKNWKKKAFKAYYDAVMVGLSNHLADANVLVERKSKVLEETKKLFRKDKTKLFTGSGQTKADIQERINLFDNMLSQIIVE